MRYNGERTSLGDIAVIRTGKLNSNAAVEGGKYPFFTCAPNPLRIDCYAYDQKAIILAGNNAEGNFHISYYEGKFNAYQRTYVIDAENESRVDLRYLYYALKLCLADFKALSQGTSTKFLTAKILNKFAISLPDIDIQKRIAKVLTLIDDKINLNNKINDNLEQQTHAFFLHLFVENANPAWKCGSISDLGRVIGGSTPSKSKAEYYTSNGIAWITPKDLSVNKSKFISHGENDITELGLKNSSASIMPKGTVLFSSRAPIGYIAIADGEVTTNQGFKSVVPDKSIGTPYVYFFLKHNLPSIENRASGSTFKEVSGAVMKAFEATIPDTTTLEVFNSFCQPIFEQQRQLEHENQTLGTLRDAILPKLMSGEIDVSAIQL